MGYVHITGQAERVNTSWKNELEAQEITEGIISNREHIQDYYGKSGKAFLIEDYVVIVTPFSVQAAVYGHALEEANQKEAAMFNHLFDEDKKKA